VPRIEEEVRPVPDGHLAHDGRAERHLDALDGVEREQAELAVEPVKLHHVVERGPRHEPLHPRGEVVRLQRPHVDQEPVVAHVLQHVQRRERVGNAQPARLQVPEQIGRGERRLCVRPFRDRRHTGNAGLRGNEQAPWCAFTAANRGV
jgi:hypothetical protein